MDATQFTTQLVQFSQVEQSVNINKYLSGLVDLQVSEQMQSAFGYVGQTVDVLSEQVQLRDGSADLFYAIAGKPTATPGAILAANGKTARTMSGDSAVVRRVGYEIVGSCRPGWSQNHKNKIHPK